MPEDTRLDRLDADVKNHGERIHSLEVRQAVAESSIKEIQSDLSAIKDDTRWLRRSITNAFIAAIIGGAIAAFLKFYIGG